MRRAFTRPKKSKFMRLISRICKLCTFTIKNTWINESHIDNYIDRFFITNCPETVSVKEVDSKTYNLFHRIFLQAIEEKKEDLGTQFYQKTQEVEDKTL